MTVSHIAAADAPALPLGFERVSEFFRVSPLHSPADPVTLTLPSTIVPPGRAAENLRLLVHTSSITGAEGSLSWLVSSAGLDVLPNGSITFALGALGDLSCFAIDTSPPAWWGG